MDYSFAISRILFGVRDLNDRRTLRIQLLKKPHHLITLLAIEVACRFVG